MFTFNDRVDAFKNDYIREYGERKYRKVHTKVKGSRIINNLIVKSGKMQLAPNHKDFIQTLNGVKYFIFSKPITFVLGAVLALELWNETNNRDNYLLDEYGLNFILDGILNYGGKMKF